MGQKEKIENIASMLNIAETTVKRFFIVRKNYILILLEK